MEQLIQEKNLSLLDLSKNLWMDTRDLRDLINDGHHVGLHSHTHPTNLSSLDLVEQKNEFENNKSQVLQITGIQPKAASFPNNSYSDQTLEILVDFGVEVCFTATPELVNQHDYIFPRYNHITIHRFLENEL